MIASWLHIISSPLLNSGRFSLNWVSRLMGSFGRQIFHVKTLCFINEPFNTFKNFRRAVSTSPNMLGTNIYNTFSSICIAVFFVINKKCVCNNTESEPSPKRKHQAFVGFFSTSSAYPPPPHPIPAPRLLKFSNKVSCHPHGLIQQIWLNKSFSTRPSCESRGGGQGGHRAPPLSLLKLVIKKMAAIGGPLYFMFLAPLPPPDHPGSDAATHAPPKRYSTSEIRQRNFPCKSFTK